MCSLPERQRVAQMPSITLGWFPCLLPATPALHGALAEGAEPPFFGFPWCHTSGLGSAYKRDRGVGEPVPDARFNNASTPVLDCAAPRSHARAVQALGPHVAALGMRFYRLPPGGLPPPALPAEFDGSVLVALHGSTSRSRLAGYKVVAVKLGPTGESLGITELAAFISNENSTDNKALGEPAGS